MYADGKFTNIRGVYVYFVALFSVSQLVASELVLRLRAEAWCGACQRTSSRAVYALVNFERVFSDGMPLQRQ